MGIDEKLKDVFGKASRRLVASLIRRNFLELGLVLTGDQNTSLETFVDSGDLGDDQWLDNLPDGIEFTEAEWSAVNTEVSALLTAVPSTIRSAVDDAAAELLRNIRADWRKRKFDTEADLTAFRIRLKNRWGRSFDELSLLHTLCREIGQEQLDRLRRSKAKTGRTKRELILRIHSRACQVSGELMTLLENGYADGAMARWRTLHELTVIAALLNQGDDELARRYKAHEVVDAKRAMNFYIRDYDHLGFAKPDETEIARLNEAYDALIAQYGRSFGSAYGWAADHLNMSSPKFTDIQHAVGRSMMQSFYKMASYTIHADPKGLSWRLSALGHTTAFIAGPSNAGFEEPGQNMALSLVVITALLVPGKKLDDVVPLSAIGLQRDKAIATLVTAGRRLSADDRKFRNK